MMNLRNLLTAAILFSASCNSPSQKNTDRQLVIGPERNEVVKLSSFTLITEIKPLSGEFIPYEADKVDFSNELIVLGDFTYAQNIFAFDKESGLALSFPLKKGEGPMEARSVSDFWIDSDIIYVLDGIGRKIIPISYSKQTFVIEEPISLDLPLRRFAKSRNGFVGLTGGGQENSLAFFNSDGALLSSFIPSDITYLMLPINPFHKIFEDQEEVVAFHSIFSPIVSRVDEGSVDTLGIFFRNGEALEAPESVDFLMNLEGFNKFRESLNAVPSLFSLFELTADQFILLYFINGQPHISLSDNDISYSIQLDKIKNDLSFDQPFPKYIGQEKGSFVALVTKDKINTEDPDFANSELAKSLKSNSESEVFLVKFQLDLQ